MSDEDVELLVEALRPLLPGTEVSTAAPPGARSVRVVDLGASFHVESAALSRTVRVRGPETESPESGSPSGAWLIRPRLGVRASDRGGGLSLQ